MAKYVTWLGQLGTIKGLSLQPYMSAVNSFFKDHGLEAVALRDLVAKVRKGLAASHVGIDDTPVRVQPRTCQLPSSSKPYASPSPTPPTHGIHNACCLDHKPNTR
jgi:hypothetical protein